jgi:hypothetical protein
MYCNYEGDLLFGKMQVLLGPALLIPPLTFVSYCVVEATNDNRNCGANYEMPHKMQSIGGVRDKYNPRFLNYFGL